MASDDRVGEVPPSPKPRTALGRNGLRIILVVAVIAVLLLARPQSGATILLVESMAVMALFALSTNLLVGHAGIVCFGEAVFFGLGSYSVAAAVQDGEPNALLLLVEAAALGGIAAGVVGAIVMRVHGIALAMSTLAVGQIFFLYFNQSDTLGGANGISAPAPLRAGNVDIASMENLYLFTIVMVLLGCGVLWVIHKSPFGLALHVIREDHVRARYLGVNSALVKVMAFVISGAMAGFAGGLSAFVNQIVTPEIFSWTNSGAVVIMAALGGFATFFGPVLGAIIFVWLENELDGGAVDPNLVVGVILLLVVMGLPKGLLSITDVVRGLGPWPWQRSRRRNRE